MDGNKAIDLIMQRLGNRKQQNLRDACLVSMELVQSELEQDAFHPWFLETEIVGGAFATVAGVESVAMPTNFLAVDDDFGQLYVFNSEITTGDQWQKVVRGTWNNIVEKYAEKGPAALPEMYDFVGMAIYFRPIPDQVVPLRLFCYIRDSAPVDAAVTNLWLTHAPDLLINKTGEYMATYHTRDGVVAGEFRRDAQRAQQKLFQNHELRRHTGRVYQMGDE